ncbi:MAG: PQQ-binding-like beta-propeller repeat protein [Abditibacteriota bacterium]|nr:PQQ-binding-like beta-propeller repeat protein [Abditibacteriota bacterium]
MKKSILGVILLIAAVAVMSAAGAYAQVLTQTVNAQNTGYTEGDLDLPLVYSFDRQIKYSAASSYATGGMAGGVAGGGVAGGGMAVAGVAGGTTGGQYGNGTNIATSRIGIGDKSILVGTSTKVYSYEKNKGRLNWQYPSQNDMENGITCVPEAEGGKVFFSTTKMLYALDEETGEVLKMRNIPNTTAAMLNAENGILYFSAGDGKIYRLDPETLEDAAPALTAENRNAVSAGARAILSNGFTIKDDLLISKSDTNTIYGFDLASGANTFQLGADGVIRGFMPIITDDYILVTTDKAVIVYTRSGKEHAMQKFSHTITCAPVTDGQNVYVATANQNLYSLRFTNSRMEQNWKKPYNMGQTISQLIALTDNVLLCACKSGFLFALDRETGAICWSNQSGRTMNNSTVSIPGYTPPTASMMGMGGMMGTMGAAGTMGTTGMTGGMTAVSQPINTKIVDGIEEVELQDILKNYSKSFVPSGLVGNAVYNNGTLAYITADGYLMVRSNGGAADKKAPEILSYYPGYDTNSRKISALPPITFKISATDKSSGVDFTTAKLTCEDSQGGEYDVRLVYDLDNQIFYGVLSKPKTSVVSPYPSGTFTSVFSVSDYAGNELNFEFSFDLDTGLQPIRTMSDTSLKYLDVGTGSVYGGQLNQLMKDAESSGTKKGGAVSSQTETSGNNNSGSSTTTAASAVSARSESGSSLQDGYDENGNYVAYDNGMSVDVVATDTDEDTSFDGYPEEGFPPFPPF